MPPPVVTRKYGAASGRDTIDESRPKSLTAISRRVLGTPEDGRHIIFAGFCHTHYDHALRQIARTKIAES